MASAATNASAVAAAAVEAEAPIEGQPVQAAAVEVNECMLDSALQQHGSSSSNLLQDG